MCSQINGDKGATRVLVATGNLVTEKTSLIAALYSEFLSDALGPILTYANLKSSLSWTKWQSGKGYLFCNDGNAQETSGKYQVQHGVRLFLELERTVAIQITGILCWELHCEVILTENFPEKLLQITLEDKQSKIWWDPTIRNTYSRMSEQIRTRCWSDALIFESCCPLKLKHGRILWKLPASLQDQHRGDGALGYWTFALDCDEQT